MPRYRKKPVEVEAFKMMSTPPDLWPLWFKSAIISGTVFTRDSMLDRDEVQEWFIKTLEGEMRIGWEDYVIQGVNGEIYPCKPDIFEKTYELVNPLRSGE